MADRGDIDRVDVSKLISEMTFKAIDPDLPLNHVYDIGGDEAQSVLERVCQAYGVDVDSFWSKVDFSRYFFMEVDPYSVIVTIWKKLKHMSGRRVQDDERDPFTVDLLVQILRSCRSEASEGETSRPAGPRS